MYDLRTNTIINFCETKPKLSELEEAKIDNKLAESKEREQ